MPLTPQAKRNLIIAGIVLILLAVAAPFAWNAVKRHRAENMAEQAEALVEEENYAKAFELARAAYALHEDLDIARLVARLSNRLDPAKAPSIWQTVYEQTGDEADAHQWFDALYRLGDMEGLNRLAKQLEQNYPKSAESLIRRAQLARANEKPTLALKLAAQAAKTPGASGEVQLAYVQLSQLSENPADREAGIAWLKEMTQRNDQTGLIATRNYLQAPGLTEAEIIATAERLANHPLAEREDKLKEIVIRRNLANQPLEALLAEAKSLFETEQPAELVEMGRWLNQNGRSADVLDVVDLETALQRQDLFLVWADSMAYQGKWDALAEVMKRTRLPIDPFVQQLFDARIKAEQGNEALADLIWSRTIIDAKNDVGKLQFAFNYATKLGWTEKSRAVLERLTVLPGAQRTAFEELIKIDQELGDVAAMRNVLRRMAELYPHDNDVANDLAYTNLLLGEEVQASGDTAVRLLNESEQPFLANLMTLALAQYQSGRPDLALEQLYTLPIDWQTVRPGWRAIYAAILSANGHERESNTVMTGVKVEDLLPPEREILRTARGG
ncbi:MAG: hypothetical protein ACQKBV_08055 [Puniceicoccales bacterium]